MALKVEISLLSFHKHHLDDFVQCSYELEYPRSEDRAKFFSRLLETAMEISEHKYNQKNKPDTPPMLPKAPKIEREKSEAELQAQVEEEEHSLRQMRMCLRDICNRSKQ
jgi:hypothetical protein